MSSIDRRIVQMRFDNAQFEKGVRTTLETLEELKKGLTLDDSRKQLSALQDVAKNLNIEHIADGVEKVSSRFGALGAIGFSALNRMTNAAIDAGRSMAAALIDPIVEGGKKRALNIEQAKFQFKGLGMDVEQSMEDALSAVKGTAFGLDEAAVVAAQFGASGVKSGAEMQKALLGISGVAAMAGSSYSDVGNIFTKVAGQGRLMGDDLNRLGVRGINAAAEIAKAMNITETEVRDLVSKGKISFNEFAKVMSDAFGEHATKANETYTGSLSNMRAALARVGADVATPYFESQRKIFNALTPVIDQVKEALEPFYKVWRRLMKVRGDAVSSFLTNLDLGPLARVLGVVGKGLDRFIKGVLQAKGPLKGLNTFVSGLAVPFRLIVRLFKTVSAVVKQALYPLNLSLGVSGKAIADFLGKIGEWFLNLEKKMTLSGSFYKFGQGILKVLKPIVSFFQSVGSIVQDGWNSFLPEGLGPAFSAAGTWFSNLGAAIERFVMGPVDHLKYAGQKISDFVHNGINFLKSAFSGLSSSTSGGIGTGFDSLKPIGEGIVTVWTNVTDTFRNAASAPGDFVRALQTAGDELRAIMQDFTSRLDPNVAMGTLNLGIVAFIAKLFKDIMGPFNSILEEINILGPVSEAINQVTDTLAAMELKLKADALLQLAIAIGILAGSLFVLSKIDPGSLGAASGAMVGLISAVLGSMKALTTMTKGTETGQFVAIGSAMLLMSSGLGIMAGALKVLSTIPIANLIAGTVVIGLLMAAFTGFVFAVSKMTGLQSAQILAASTSILILGTGLSVLAGAVKLISMMDPESFANGLKRMLAMIAGIGITMALMPKTALLGAAALTVVAFALTLLTGPLAILGTFSPEMISKSLIMLAGSLAIIAVAMYAMTAAIPGALALLVVAGALTVLSGVLMVLGALPWDFVFHGLLVMGTIFAALAVSALLMAPAIPLIALLGAAIALLGIGAMAAGTGMLLAANALAVLATVGFAGAQVVLSFVRGLINMIPLLGKKVGEGIVMFAMVITQSAPVLAGALGAILLALIDTLKAVIPRLLELLFETLENLVTGLLEYLVTMVPRLVDGGLRLLTALLDGISNNIGNVVSSATDVITSFMDALGENIPKLVDSGFEMIIKIIDGIADAIEKNVPELIEAGQRLGRAIIDGLEQVVTSVPVLGDIYNWGKNLGQKIYDGAKDILGIASPSKKFRQIGKFVIEGFVQGLVGGKDAVIGTYQVMRDALSTFIDESDREIEQHKRRLDELKKNSTKNEKEIAKTERALKRLRKERKASVEALEALKEEYKENGKELRKLGRDHDKLTRKIEKETQALKDAKATRDDYRETIEDQYNELPSLVGDEENPVNVDSWTESTEEQIQKTKEFASALQRLRDRGLNDTMYKKLLEEGVDALPFVQDLLEAGDSGVRDINKLADDLEAVSKKLGKTASASLYQAAVDSAQGIVDGLKKQQKAIEKEMRKIAKAMAKAIKKELGIKSPSRVFRKIAIQTADGLIGGLKKAAPDAAKASTLVGQRMSSALEDALNGVNTFVDSDMELSPRISPVLDLSAVRKDSNILNGMFGQTPIRFDTSYAQASSLAAAIRSGEGFLGSSTAPVGTTIEITQHNTSPKALSSSEIYRQTKNALSVAKGELPS